MARKILEEMLQEEDQKYEETVAGLNSSLTQIQDELNNLTRACSRLTIDEDSYTTAATELMTRKASLKRKKAQIEGTSGSIWFEPIQDILETLDQAAKQQESQSVPEIAALVQKVGTNHTFSRKTVRFDWAEPYAYTVQVLTQMRRNAATNESPADNELYSRTCWLRDLDSNQDDTIQSRVSYH